MSLRKISDLEGLNIFERMRDNENPQLSNDMLNSLFEISYLTSKVDENDSTNTLYSYKSMYTRYSELRNDIIGAILCSNNTCTVFEVPVIFTSTVYMLDSLYLSGNFYLNLDFDEDTINSGEKDPSRQNLGSGYEMYIKTAANTLCAMKDDNTLIAVQGNNVLNAYENNVLYAGNVNILCAQYGTEIYAAGQTTPIASFTGAKITFNKNLDLGSNNITANMLYGVSLCALWADLAEMYESDKNYSPGTLVKFGGEKELTIANHGDIANGVVTTSPALLLNAKDCNDKTMCGIALVGRTYVKVIGPVKKFSNLYLHDNGVAATLETIEKLIGCSNYTCGNLVGKALQAVDQSIDQTSLVEAVVQLSI